MQQCISCLWVCACLGLYLATVHLNPCFLPQDFIDFRVTHFLVRRGYSIIRVGCDTIRAVVWRDSAWACESARTSYYPHMLVSVWTGVCVCVVWDQRGSAEEEKLKARAIYQEHSIFSWFMRQNTGKYTAHILWVTVNRTVITTQTHKLRKLLWEFFFFLDHQVLKIWGCN